MRFIKLTTLLALLCFASCEDLLEVPDISTESVELLAPSNSTLVQQSDVNFTWNEVYEATQYHVQIAAPSFENAAQIVLDTLVVVDSSFVRPSFTKNLFDSSYEWRVKAMNSGYETEFSINQFSVEAEDNSETLDFTETSSVQVRE